MQRVEARRQVWDSGYPTKRAAEDALNDSVSAVRSGSFVAASKQTLEQYLVSAWLPSKKPSIKDGRGGNRGRVSLATWDQYSTYATKYIAPHIGSVLLQDLGPRHIEDLYDHLEQAGGRNGKGLAQKTVANVHGILHKALGDAVRRGLVLRNPVDAVEAPRTRRPKPTFWEVEELRAFVKHVEGDRLYAVWLLFATTGMRRGEVAGLSWDDIDLEKGALRVQWTLGIVGNRPTWKQQPKSRAGERTMALDPDTVEALRQHRARQAEERLAWGPAWKRKNPDERGNSRTDLVFVHEDGRMINPERFSTWFQKAAKDADLPRIRLHDLRHTYASAALRSATGWHEVKIISERLGHASIGITLDTYSHVLPSADEQVAHSLARHILGLSDVSG
jgi:integrase